MTEAPAPNVSELAVAEIERRLQWRAMPALMFLGVLALLLGVAFWPNGFPPKHITGLPDDPDAFAAATQLRNHVVLPSRELRFESAITGDVVPGMRPGTDMDERIARAAALVTQARPRFGGNIRWRVAGAALALARHDYRAAERDYRYALDRYPNYPEARLGLGVTLVLAGDIEPNMLAQRQQFLRAIAQFAEIGPRDAEYEEAVFNRAMMLDRVGRHDEAARVAREYLTRGVFVGAARMREIAAAG